MPDPDPDPDPKPKPKPSPNVPVEPRNHLLFDAWNSSSTGHQRAENPYSGTTAWRETRSRKLSSQFRSGDCLPNKSETQQSATGKGEWRWVSDEDARRSQLGVRDIRNYMGVGKRKADTGAGENHKKAKVEEDGKENSPSTIPADSQQDATDSELNIFSSHIHNNTVDANATSSSTSTPRSSDQSPKQKSTVFTGTTIYINGSTLPQISDHKLKHLLVAHGANISINMARKSVTHVIVGQPNTGAGLGAGGGLSARKLQQEIARGGWKGVKIVSVEWVLESIKAERRLSESRFAVVHVAAKGQRSVRGMFGG
ncbi:hypothetical protein N7474_007017 [Penicillium riverlandense]|uniref:uncharacterized protein n=1 Tax=Penicillium riverlandense TaxID=1903569 RepID=UPI002548399C|nr:uncharacterized protein N7474_007017 [Penicillium riverlandense]KAJ5815240.1 hypothetical protein N7474_007017 [Penicillium riverlandense]